MINKLTNALENVLIKIEKGDIECRCKDGYTCYICEAKKVLAESQELMSKGNPMDVRVRSKIYCITTNMLFDNLKLASDFYGIQSATISKCCKGQLKVAGKFANVKLEWRYATKEDIEKAKIYKVMDGDVCE